MPRFRLSKIVEHCYAPSVLLVLGAVITWDNLQRPQPATDVLLGIFDRLESPGLLSRDLVAADANLSFTACDEITLLLSRLLTHSLPRSLELQSLLCTVGLGFGFHLLASSMKLSKPQSLLVAVSALLVAATLFRSDPFLLVGEETPAVFALAWTILAVGLLGKRRTVAAGVVGGLALLYDFRMALPFWVLTFVALAWNRLDRPLLKPLAWIFLVFVLLLGNLAQLQPVPARVESVWTRIVPSIAAIDRRRLPWQWIDAWSWSDFVLFLAVAFLALGSLVFVWDRVPRLLRPYLVGLPLFGLASVPLTMILVDHARFSLIVRVALPAWISFDACCVLLFAAVILVKSSTLRSKTFLFSITCLLSLCFAVASWRSRQVRQTTDEKEIADLAHWAEENTWAGSMFLFPDSGKAGAPSTFRAAAKRALWVDWASGLQVNTSQALTDEWWRRWEDTMQKDWSPQRLASMLALPIDYYVLGKRNQLTGIKPTFATAHLVVYEADVLRSVNSERARPTSKAKEEKLSPGG